MRFKQQVLGCSFHLSSDLVREGLSMSLVEAGPSFSTTKLQIEKSINEWIHHKSKEWWLGSLGQRQAKNSYRPEFTSELPNKDRKTVKIFSIYNIDVVEDALCRFCKEEEESPIHVLCHCEDLARTSALLYKGATLKDDRSH